MFLLLYRHLQASIKISAQGSLMRQSRNVNRLNSLPTHRLFTPPRLWSDYQYGTNVALALPVICQELVAGQVFLSLWWTCRRQVRTSAPRLYIKSRSLILFGDESLYYWFWLRLYIRLQFVPHPSLSEAHYIKPTINLQALLTVCSCEWI